MRVVINTNVIISAGMKANTSPRVALRWVGRHAQILKSQATEQEFLLTIAKPKLAMFLVGGGFLPELKRMVGVAELIQITRPVRICRDPGDDKFLELAMDGRADLILSGDADLLSLHPVRGIPIISPGAFVRSVAG